MKLGIWIDHKKATVVSVTRDQSVVTRLRSSVRPHGRYHGAQDGGGEHKYEVRHKQGIAHYLDAVIRHVDRSDEIRILGPGETRGELKRRIRAVKALAGVPVTTSPAASMTDRQLVAAVRKHYRLPA